MEICIHITAIAALFHVMVLFVFVEMTTSLHPNTGTKYKVDVDVNVQVGVLSHFWRSTGFCPPEPHNEAGHWFLSDDMTQNLIYIGGVPHSGIEQVRIHYLYEAVAVTKFINGEPVFNFTLLDQFIHNLVKNGLKPGFELMGNPSAIFYDFENNTQILWWVSLVSQTAARYVERYGLEMVEKWNFESWNEPRQQRFDNMNMTLKGFLNYYDACTEGLSKVSKSLRIGTPGGACSDKYSPETNYCWGLLKHIDSGSNYFSGKVGGKIDFISMHRKGEEPNNTAAIFKKELNGLNLLHQNLPRLSTVPFFNDEADPLVSWNKDKFWRGDAYYAAMVAKIVVQHQNLWIVQPAPVPVNYALLSNDNGFLSYNPYFFTERTLLARFQMNNTHPPHVQFIRKPVHSVMGLLALLGEKQLQDTVSGSHSSFNGSQGPDYGSEFGLFSTVHEADPLIQEDSWQLSILSYFSKDSDFGFGFGEVQLELRQLNNITKTDLIWTAYRINLELNCNPYGIWLQMGSPKTPTLEQFQGMRATEDPVRIFDPKPFDVKEDSNTSWDLNMPGVMMIHVCEKAKAPPGEVIDVRFHNITFNQVLISWKDTMINTKCVKTYDVEYSLNGDTFQKINNKDSIFTTFVYAPIRSKKTTGFTVYGFYRVRAVDYWVRNGSYSTVLKYE